MWNWRRSQGGPVAVQSVGLSRGKLWKWDFGHISMLVWRFEVYSLKKYSVPLFTKQYNLVLCEGFHITAPVCGSIMGPMNKGSIVVAVLQRSWSFEPRYKLSTLLYMSNMIHGCQVQVEVCVTWRCSRLWILLIILLNLGIFYRHKTHVHHYLRSPDVKIPPGSPLWPPPF